MFKSGYIPRILGLLPGLAALGYLTESFEMILFPGAEDALAAVVMVLAIPGELLFALWLVLKGIHTDRRARQARALA